MFTMIRRLWANLTRLADESAGLADDFATMRRGLRSAGAMPQDEEVPALPALPAPDEESRGRRRK